MEEREAKVIEIIGTSTKRIFSKTVEASLPKLVDSVATMALTSLPVFLKPLVSTFATELTKAIISSLINSEDALAEVRRLINSIVKEPFQTGVEQLQIALNLPSDTSERKKHRDERFRNALLSFDHAAQLSKQERPLIDLCRGLAALHIPGADQEAAHHFQTFQIACQNRAAELSQIAVSLEAFAIEREKEAARMLTRKPSLAGGGLIGWSESSDQLRKAVLEKEIREKRLKAASVRAICDDLSEVIHQANFLIKLIQDQI